jgi:hypothetical protein
MFVKIVCSTKECEPDVVAEWLVLLLLIVSASYCEVLGSVLKSQVPYLTGHWNRVE